MRLRIHIHSTILKKIINKTVFELWDFAMSPEFNKSFPWIFSRKIHDVNLEKFLILGEVAWNNSKLDSGICLGIKADLDQTFWIRHFALFYIMFMPYEWDWESIQFTFIGSTDVTCSGSWQKWYNTKMVWLNAQVITLVLLVIVIWATCF